MGTPLRGSHPRGSTQQEVRDSCELPLGFVGVISCARFRCIFPDMGGSPSQLVLRLLDRMSRVIRVLLAATIVFNSPNDFFRIVATCQGALGIGPIVLGLAQPYVT